MLFKLKESKRMSDRRAAAPDQEAWQAQHSLAQARLCEEFRHQQYFYGYRPC